MFKTLVERAREKHCKLEVKEKAKQRRKRNKGGKIVKKRDKLLAKSNICRVIQNSVFQF